MPSLSEMVRNSLDDVFAKFGKNASFVIYPFGEGGKILKGIMNYEYGVRECAIIDNRLADINSDIKKLSYLKDCPNVIVLFSSYRADQYNDIRRRLDEYISRDRCVEIFGKKIWEDEYYYQLMKLSKIYSPNKNFIRVGRENDGGYIMVDDMKGGIAYSFGINDDPSWDLEMVRYGYDVYMYDHTVDTPKATERYKDKMHFFKIGIADRCISDKLKTLDELIKQNGHENNNDMILKMDVEGAEWGFIAMTPSSTFEKFKQIVFEFHDMNSLDKHKRNDVLAGLSKLSDTHKIVHIHGNNWGGFISSPTHIIPDLWEVTYMRNDCEVKCVDDISLPISIDEPCNKWKEEIVLGNWNAPFLTVRE